MTKNDKYKYRYSKVKSYLLEKIEEMESGERIPSRNKLIEKLGVTRTTVDRAISELIGEGYLYTINGSGTYVHDLEKLEGGGAGSRAIGVVIPDISSYDYPQIVKGISDVADEYDYNLMICNTENRPKSQKRQIGKMISSEIRGLIIVPVARDVEVESFWQLGEEEIPFVFCNRGIDGVDAPRIVANDFYGSYRATRHFLNLGYRRIAFLSSPFYITVQNRLEGYLGALQENGIECEQELIVFEEKGNGDTFGREGIRKLLDLDKRPEAVLCTDDVMAFQAYRVLAEQGIRVPADMALIGFDNSSLCETMPVPLTSVDLRKDVIGEIAARILIEELIEGEGADNPVRVLNPHVVVRESCGKKIHPVKQEV